MSKRIDPIDIVGKKFGELTVIEYNRLNGKRKYYLCKCSCGRKTVVERYNLLSGHTTTCGYCTGKKCDPNDIIGHRFGQLTVKSYTTDKYGSYHYLCQCDCGREQLARRCMLLKGTTVSCAYCANRKIDIDDIIGLKFGKLDVLSYVGQKDHKRIYLCRCECGKEIEVKRTYLLNGETATCGNCSHIDKEDDHYRYYCHNGDSWIFDEVDLEFVKKHRWYISHDGYPHTKIGKKSVIFHRLLLNPSNYETVDHINGDTRNNRRGNLRITSQAMNSRNQVINATNTSGFKGVSFNKAMEQYEAYINYAPYKKKNLGFYDNPEEAARTYDEAARKYFGEFACVNFPRPGEQGCHRKREMASTNSVKEMERKVAI